MVKTTPVSLTTYAIMFSLAIYTKFTLASISVNGIDYFSSR